MRAGQSLVLETYEALRNSPQWEDTLLVIAYDEHGGFYDHVTPPRLDVDDGSGYATYGLRVPALLVGPRVVRHVCHEQFDHTSIVKTILTRFAPQPQQAIANMGRRVEHAPHLGVALSPTPRTDTADRHRGPRQGADTDRGVAGGRPRVEARERARAIRLPRRRRAAARPARVPRRVRQVHGRDKAGRAARRGAVGAGRSRERAGCDGAS